MKILSCIVFHLIFLFNNFQPIASSLRNETEEATNLLQRVNDLDNLFKENRIILETLQTSLEENNKIQDQILKENRRFKQALDQLSEFHNITLPADVPNSPRLGGIVCHYTDASVTWQPMGDNHSPILSYTIQHNTSFTPATWENSFDNFPATSHQVNVNMSPWANYTFRVIARNKIGPSDPSEHSSVCTTPENVPYKNPDGVQGKGSTPQNLVIKWSPMPEIEHNGPGFKYRIYWKRDDIYTSKWETAEVNDWERDQFLVPNQPTFKPYRIKVEAHNDLGEAHVAAPEIIGYSGEGVPMEAPTNFSHGVIDHPTTVELSWGPVSEESIRGHFKGYKIQMWTEETKARREFIVENNKEPRAVVDSFVPNTKNYARVLVFNGAHNGPPSAQIELDMPEGRTF